MTAIFATLFAPTVARVRSQRSSRTSALLLVALALSACGGISVHHDDPDAGTDVEGTGGGTSGGKASGGGTQSHPASVDDNTACQHVCEACNGATAGSCDTLCGIILSGAQQAGCASALSNLLRCQDTTNSGCSLQACPSQNNSFSVCVLDYCDDHVNEPVCVAPL